MPQITSPGLGAVAVIASGVFLLSSTATKFWIVCIAIVALVARQWFLHTKHRCSFNRVAPQLPLTQQILPEAAARQAP